MISGLTHGLFIIYYCHTSNLYLQTKNLSIHSFIHSFMCRLCQTERVLSTTAAVCPLLQYRSYARLRVTAPSRKHSSPTGSASVFYTVNSSPHRDAKFCEKNAECTYNNSRPFYWCTTDLISHKMSAWHLTIATRLSINAPCVSSETLNVLWHQARPFFPL